MAEIFPTWIKSGTIDFSYEGVSLPINYHVNANEHTEQPDSIVNGKHRYNRGCYFEAGIPDSAFPGRPYDGYYCVFRETAGDWHIDHRGYAFWTFVFNETNIPLTYKKTERYSIRMEGYIGGGGSTLLLGDAPNGGGSCRSLISTYGVSKWGYIEDWNGVFPDCEFILRVQVWHYIEEWTPVTGTRVLTDEIVYDHNYSLGTAAGAEIDITKPSLTGLTFGYQLSNIHQYLDGEDDLRLYYGATFGHPTWKTGDYYQNRAIIRVGQNRQEQFVSAQEGWLQTDEGETTTISRNIVCDDDVPPTLSICNIDLTVVANTGQETRQKVYARRPCCVTGVTIQPPSSMLPGETQQLYWSLQGERGLTPDDPSVTITSSAPSVISVDENGMLTAGSNLGTAIITVESNDYTEINGHKYNHHYAQVTVFNTSSFKPEFADTYDYLSASLAQNIASAIIYLAQEAGIVIPCLYSLNGYATPIKDIRKILDSYHAGILLLCDAYGITHTLPDSFPIQNNNEVWFDIVNEWIDKIQDMYDTLEV